MIGNGIEKDRLERDGQGRLFGQSGETGRRGDRVTELIILKECVSSQHVGLRTESFVVLLKLHISSKQTWDFSADRRISAD